jgi:hypothetical protein
MVQEIFLSLRRRQTVSFPCRCIRISPRVSSVPLRTLSGRR